MEKIKLAYQDYYMAKYSSPNYTLQEGLDNTFGEGVASATGEGPWTITVGEKNYNLLLDGTVTPKQIQEISKSTNIADSYVGCYADIDEDGEVDGVIFVDLLTGSVRNTQEWGNSNGVYSLPTNVTINNVNTYYISQDSYTWSGITKPVISPKTTNKEQRFYVMQLNDFTTSAKTDGTEEENYPAYINYKWYNNAYGYMSPLITSSNFGEGKENTRKMIEKWNAAGTVNGYTDSSKDNRDIWKHLQTKYNQGWFLPSKAELAAFAQELGINSSNYSNYGLTGFYWSSSQDDENFAWNINMNLGFMDNNPVFNLYEVRLVKNF